MAIRKLQSSQRWLMLGLIFLIYSFAVADRITISIAAPAISKALHIGPVELGFIFSAFMWGYGLCAIPAGIIVDKLGAKRAMTYGVIVWTIGTVLGGFAGLVTNVVVFLFLTRLLIGVAEAVVTPGSASVLASWFPDRERGLASSLWASSTYVMVAIMSPLMGWIADAYGWEHVFWLIGGSGFVALSLWVLFYFDPLKNPRLSAEELNYIVEGGALGGSRKAAELPRPSRRDAISQAVREMFILLKTRQMAVVFFAQYCGNSIAFFLLTWLPTYLVHEKGTSITKAGFMFSLPGVMGAIGAIASGALVDLIFRRTGSLGLSRKIPLTIGYLMTVSIALLPFANSTVGIVALMAIAFFGKGMANLGWTLVTDLAPRSLVGTAGGMLNSLGTIGSILTSVGIGAIVEYSGSFDLALLFVAAHGVMAIAAFWLFIKQMKRVTLDEGEGESELVAVAE